jgi:hypothetical protein
MAGREVRQSAPGLDGIREGGGIRQLRGCETTTTAAPDAKQASAVEQVGAGDGVPDAGKLGKREVRCRRHVESVREDFRSHGRKIFFPGDGRSNAAGEHDLGEGEIQRLLPYPIEHV